WDMHSANGLIDECYLSHYGAEQAQDLLAVWFDKQFGNDTPVIVSDNVEFDLGMLAQHMPQLHGRLGYRRIDVSHVRRLSRLWFDDISRVREAPARHRALSDIYRGIAELREYRETIFRSDRKATA